MSRQTDQRSAFIAEYAAKRQGQLERAKQLREQRSNIGSVADVGDQPPALPRSGGSMRQPNSSSEYRGNTGNTYDDDDLVQKTTRIRAGGPVASSTAMPVSSRQSAAYEYPPPLGTQPQMPSAHAVQPPNLRQRTVEVTEQHFREATQRGIITPDQARQLWAVISDQAMQVAPPAGFTSSLRQSAPAQSGVGYDPRSYAPPTPVQASAVPQGTYNGSFAHQLALGGKGAPMVLDSDEYPPDTPPVGTRLAKNTASRIGSRRPEWNSDFATDEAAEPSAGVESARAQQTKPQPKIIAARNTRPEWSTDFAEGDSGFGAPPPPKQSGGGRRPRSDEAEVPPLNQVLAPKQQLSVKQQQQAPSAAAPKRSVMPTRGRQQAPPPEPEAPVQDESEIAEFMRQKEIARLQFENALQEAASSEPMVPCENCGRKFRESIIDRHESACQTATKKRRVFDSKTNRLSGIDGMEEVVMQQQRTARRGGGKAAPQQQQQPQASRHAEPVMPANKMPKWKLQHQQFQAALAAIRQAAQPGGLTAPPIAMPEALDDRVPCPHCSRKFAAETASRHIPHCAKTVNKPKPVVRPGGKR